MNELHLKISEKKNIIIYSSIQYRILGMCLHKKKLLQQLGMMVIAVGCSSAPLWIYNGRVPRITGL